MAEGSSKQGKTKVYTTNQWRLAGSENSGGLRIAVPDTHTLFMAPQFRSMFHVEESDSESNSDSENECESCDCSNCGTTFETRTSSDKNRFNPGQKSNDQISKGPRKAGKPKSLGPKSKIKVKEWTTQGKTEDYDINKVLEKLGETKEKSTKSKTKSKKKKSNLKEETIVAKGNETKQSKLNAKSDKSIEKVSDSKIKPKNKEIDKIDPKKSKNLQVEEAIAKVTIKEEHYTKISENECTICTI